MNNGKSKIVWQPQVLQNTLASGKSRGLTKAAAYVRGVAKRKIKRRKNKKSAPGHAPYDHGHLKKSIAYAVDKRNAIAYIGPRRTLGRENAVGEIAPHILEFGGMSSPGGNANWFRIKGVPKVSNKGSIATYFRQIGYGPVFMGISSSEVKTKANHREQTRRGASSKWHDRIRTKYSTFLKKNIFYLDLKIRSDKMARKAADNAVQHFGYPTVPTGRIAPRPYMGPSLSSSKSYIARCLTDLL